MQEKAIKCVVQFTNFIAKNVEQHLTKTMKTLQNDWLQQKCLANPFDKSRVHLQNNNVQNRENLLKTAQLSM